MRYRLRMESEFFKKKKVVYTSNYEINKVGENVYIDEDEYIVNFI